MAKQMLYGEEARRSLERGVKINGMNISKATERFNGDESVLIDILNSYVSGTRPLLQKLNEYLSNNNLKDYAVIIHGYSLYFSAFIESIDTLFVYCEGYALPRRS